MESVGRRSGRLERTSAWKGQETVEKTWRNGATGKPCNAWSVEICPGSKDELLDFQQQCEAMGSKTKGVAQMADDL